jgi:hypothetical protein
LHTTAADVSKFLGSMLDYGEGDLWVGRETGEQALTCQEPEHDGGAECEFGVNWALLKNPMRTDLLPYFAPMSCFNWTNAAFHNGLLPGIQTLALIFPEEGIYASVFTNADGDGLASFEMMLEMFTAITEGDCEAYLAGRSGEAASPPPMGNTTPAPTETPPLLSTSSAPPQSNTNRRLLAVIGSSLVAAVLIYI